MSFFESLVRSESITRRWPGLRRWFPLLVLVAAVVVISLGWLLKGFIFSLEGAGYLGVFLLSLLGSASLLFPVPGLVSVCVVSTSLIPFVVGIVAGTGETVGEITGYALGFGGGAVLEKNRHYPRLRRWMERRGMLVIFLVSVIPNPIFDVVGIAAGGLRYPLRRFLAVVFVGKVLKDLLVAYTCFYGVSLLPWLPWVD